jgi:pilus assembly protein CpaB
MSRRTLLLIAALVLAAVGTVLVFMYAQNAQNVATEGQTLKKVLVAKTAIEVGTTGAAAAASGSFTEQELPASAIVDGAIDDAAPLASLVTTVPIFPGQQIISQQWGAAALATGLTIPEGKIAVSIQLGDPERVAGLPGVCPAVYAGRASPGVSLWRSDRDRRLPARTLAPCAHRASDSRGADGGGAQRRLQRAEPDLRP